MHLYQSTLEQRVVSPFVLPIGIFTSGKDLGSEDLHSKLHDVVHCVDLVLSFGWHKQTFFRSACYFEVQPHPVNPYL